MANRVAKFEKISYEQFEKDFYGSFTLKQMMNFGILNRDPEYIYNHIKLPERATKFSAGYDFYSPIPFTLKPGKYVKIPTGIRCRMNNDYVLQIYPRSSLGFKYMLIPMNLVAIVDCDYYDSDNEGHIFIKLKNCGDQTVAIDVGDAICQGIFVTYGITEDDNVHTSRNGGIGSTNNKKE